MSSSSTTVLPDVTDLITPDITDLITEDDTPVDNLSSEKHRRLLTEPLYSSWTSPHPGQPFLVAADVGVFAVARNPAIVPDVFLSLDVEPAADWWQREHRSYFLWEFGKAPEVVIELVSNTKGEEDGSKLQKYAQMRVLYYIIYDPRLQIMDDVLTVYRLDGIQYVRQTSTQLAGMGLGVTLWEGTYEGRHDTWLRWTDTTGAVIPTGKERAEQESQRAEQERQRAEQERQRAEQEQSARQDMAQQLAQAEQRAAQLAALLRQLGHEPPA